MVIILWLRIHESFFCVHDGYVVRICILSYDRPRVGVDVEKDEPELVTVGRRF